LCCVCYEKVRARVLGETWAEDLRAIDKAHKLAEQTRLTEQEKPAGSVRRRRVTLLDQEVEHEKLAEQDLAEQAEQKKLAEQDLRKKRWQQDTPALELQIKLEKQAATQAPQFQQPSGPPPTSSLQMPPPPTGPPPPTVPPPPPTGPPPTTGVIRLKPKLLLLGKKMPVPQLQLKTLGPRPPLRLNLPNLQPVLESLARPAGQPKPPTHAPPQHIVDRYVVRHTRNSERIIHVRIL
jgi:hypothetical protein